MADESSSLQSELESKSSSTNPSTDPPGTIEGLVSKRNTKAFIWKYFGFLPDENGRPRGNPKCRLCGAEVLAKDSNTSNLYSHLCYKHPDEHSIVQAATGTKGKKTNDDSCRQPSLETTWDKTKMLSAKSQEYRRLMKSVTFCLARDMLPISTVDKVGFREMLRTFNPRYKLLCRNHFINIAIPELVAETRSSIESQITDGNIYHFAATTDMWTSAAGDPYITLTCHAISQQWELKSYCLQTHYLPQDHTAVNIKDVLLETLHEWNLEPDKLVGITTDIGFNVKLACELLGWIRLSCFGHNLNVAVGKGLNDTRIQRALRVCRALVASFSRSWKKQRDLVEAQEQKNLPIHKLKVDVTRWGSCYDMVERVLEQLEAIRMVLCDDRNSSHLIPSWQDSDMLESIAAALKLLKVMTDALYSEQCVTISAVIPLLSHIYSTMEHEVDDTEITDEIKERIMEDLKTRYMDPDMRQLLELASFLDPRFKLAHVTDKDGILKEIEKQMMTEINTETLTSAQASVSPQSTASRSCDTGPSSSLSSATALAPPPSKKVKGLSKILSNCFGNAEVQVTPQQRVKQEIAQYLTHPQLSMEVEPLPWWKS